MWMPIIVAIGIQPSKDVHVLMPEPENISLYVVRGLYDIIGGGSLRQGDYPGLSRRLQCNHKGLYKKEARRSSQ